MGALLGLIGTLAALGVYLVFRKSIISAVQSVFAMVAIGVMRAIWTVSPKVANEIAKAIMDVMFRNTKIWSSIVAEYMKTLFPDIKFPSPEALVAPKDVAGVVTEALAAGMFKKMVEYVAPKGPITPEMGLTAANRFFSINLSFQMSAWLLHWISDTFSLGSMKSFKDLPNAIMWSFGLGWLSWLVMGTPMRKAISDPLEIYYNRIYQTERPTLAQFMEYAFATDMKYEDIREVLKDYGYNSKNSAIVITSFQKRMTPTDGEKLYKYGVWSEDTYKSFLSHLGYHPEHVKYLVQLAKLEEVANPLRETVEVLIDLAIRGQVNMSVVKDCAKEIGITDDELDALYTYRYYKALRDNTLSKSEILTAYQRGLIDENATREKLRLLGYFDDDIDIILAVQSKTLSVAQIKQLYLSGVIDGEQAIDRLVKLGYSREDAELLMYVFDPSLTPGQIIDAMFNGYISIPQALDLLKRKGYTEEEAYAIIFSYATPSTINNLFKYLSLGILSQEEVRDRLRLLKIPEKVIDELFSSGGKQLTLKQLQDLFYSQQIRRTEVYQKLLSLGYDEQTAKALLDTYFKPYEIIKWDPNTQSIINTGQIWE